MGNIKDYEACLKNAFTMKGNSMDDGTKRGYLENDTLLCREVDRTCKGIELYRGYVIITSYAATVRQITRYDRKSGCIECHAYNPAFEDFKIPVEDITGLFLIEQVQRDLSPNI